MKRCIVVLSGSEPPSEFENDDITICADSGALSLYQRGVIPDHIVGDMDSISEDALKEMEASGSLIEVHPVEKDRTDGELAVQKAISSHPDAIDIYGKSSGRADHLLACYHLLHIIPPEISSSLHLGDDKVLLVREGNEIEVVTERSLISVLPSTKTSTVTIRGLKWELEREQLILGSTRGIHNENPGRPFLIRAVEGDIYVILVRGSEDP